MQRVWTLKRLYMLAKRVKLLKHPFTIQVDLSLLRFAWRFIEYLLQALFSMSRTKLSKRRASLLREGCDLLRRSEVPIARLLISWLLVDWCSCTTPKGWQTGTYVPQAACASAVMEFCEGRRKKASYISAGVSLQSRESCVYTISLLSYRDIWTHSSGPGGYNLG